MHIPQITDRAAEQQAISSSRACLTTYPAQAGPLIRCPMGGWLHVL